MWTKTYGSRGDLGYVWWNLRRLWLLRSRVEDARAQKEDAKRWEYYEEDCWLKMVQINIQILPRKALTVVFIVRLISWGRNLWWINSERAPKLSKGINHWYDSNVCIRCSRSNEAVVPIVWPKWWPESLDCKAWLDVQGQRYWGVQGVWRDVWAYESKQRY